MRWSSKLVPVLALLGLISFAWAQSFGPPGGGGSGCTLANPTATASDTAVNGVATTCMRSDAAPAVQKATNAQFGLAECGAGITCTAGVITPTAGQALNSTAIGSPTGTTSTSAVMQGNGSICKLTPAYSTRIKIEFHGVLSNSTISDGIVVGTRFGTGTAPINGAAATGTVVDLEVSVSADPTATSTFPFYSGGVVTGLTPGTAYWFDLTQRVITGGNGTALNVTCTVYEF